MDFDLADLFSGAPPSLVLSAGRARAGALDERSARQAAQDLAGRMAPESLPVLQGLALLWHDHWTPAHEIAQSREGEPDHDLLQAILHRREGDFANAGYWFRRAGKHACYPILERGLASAGAGRLRAADVGGALPAVIPAVLPAIIPGMENGRWSPSVFLAAVRTRAQSGEAETGEGSVVLRFVQAEEFRAFAVHLLSA